MVKKPIKSPIKSSDKPAPKDSSSKSSTTNKSKANNPEIAKLVNDLNKKFGDNAVQLGFGGEGKDADQKIKRIPTGSFSLDLALGGGIPVGRFTQISGALSTTKTTQTLHIIRNAQKMGITCMLVDVENTTDEQYLESIGVDVESLLHTNPDSLEEAADIILTAQRSGLVGLAVLDSIAALSSNTEQQSNMDENTRMGVTPSLLGEFCRKYQMNNNRLSREGLDQFTLIALNQLREKIGSYGDPEYTPGGRAIGFTASVDLRLRRGDWITEGSGTNKTFVGQVVKFKVEKNKTYKRMMTGEFDFYYGQNNAGVLPYYNDCIKEVITAGVEWGLIKRSGAWFVYNDQKYQGISSLIDALRDNEDLVESIKSQVLEIALK